MANETRKPLVDREAAPPFEWALQLVGQLLIPEATGIAYYSNSLLQTDDEAGEQRTSELDD